MQKVLFWRGFELFPYTCSKPLPNNTFGTFDHTCLQMSIGLKATHLKHIDIWRQDVPKVQKVSVWRVFLSYSYLQSAQKPLPINTFGTFGHTCLQMSMGLIAYTFKAHRHLEARWAKSAKSALWERFLGRLYIGIQTFLSVFAGPSPVAKVDEVWDWRLS